MNALGVAGLWLGTGLLAAALLPRLRLRRLAPIVFVVAAAGAVAVHPGDWLGPFAGSPGSVLSLGRASAGLICAVALSMALIWATAPPAEAGKIVAAAVTGAAVVIFSSATEPLVWAVAVVVAVMAVSLCWLMAQPGRATLAAARIAGVGAVVCLSVTPFWPITDKNPNAVANLLFGWLLAGALCALLALVPLGGWALASLRALRSVEASLWLVLVAPALLLAGTTLHSGMPDQSNTIIDSVLVVAGLASALWSALWACLGRSEERYVRVALADIGLAAAGIGTATSAGKSGLLLLILAQVVVAPLLLNGSQSRSRWSWVCGWLVVSGLPPSLGFWGRLLILEACVDRGTGWLLVCMATGVLLSYAAVLALRGSMSTHSKMAEERLAALPLRLVTGGLAVVALGAGLFPQGVAHLVFGQL